MANHIAVGRQLIFKIDVENSLRNVLRYEEIFRRYIRKLFIYCLLYFYISQMADSVNN